MCVCVCVCVCVRVCVCVCVCVAWQIRAEEEKFRRLLQILGVWYEKGQTLVFVDTQQRCDTLFMELVRAGYSGLTLHGGKDRNDRDHVRILGNNLFLRDACAPLFTFCAPPTDCA